MTLTEALAYTSSTAIGGQVAALQTLYNDINNFNGPSGDLSVGIAKLQWLNRLGDAIIALATLDGQLLTWEQAIAAYIQQHCQTSSSSAPAPAPAPPCSSPLVTGAIAAAAAVAGGIVGFMAGKALPQTWQLPWGEH